MWAIVKLKTKYEILNFMKNKENVLEQKIGLIRFSQTQDHSLI